jgi:hypothetical protein
MITLSTMTASMIIVSMITASMTISMITVSMLTASIIMVSMITVSMTVSITTVSMITLSICTCRPSRNPKRAPFLGPKFGEGAMSEGHFEDLNRQA